MRESTLDFVELAARDRSGSGVEWMQFTDTGSSDHSLLTLARVINALGCGNSDVPYR